MTIEVVVDPNHCPDCGTVLVAGAPACAACGLPLRGPLAGALWHTTQQMASLDGERRRLLASLRAAAPAAPGAPALPPMAPPAVPPLPPATPPAYADPYAAPGAAPPPGYAAPPPGYAAPPPGWAPPTRREQSAEAAALARMVPEWTPKNLLLATGATLLAVAAIIFTAVRWSDLSIGWRATVMLGATGVAAAAGEWARRRELPSSAEAFASLAVVLAVIDAYALRRAGLGGLDGTDGLTYWTAATAVLGAAAGGYAWVTRLKVPAYAALLLVQFPIALTAARPDLAFASRAGWVSLLALSDTGLGWWLSHRTPLRDLGELAEGAAAASGGVALLLVSSLPNVTSAGETGHAALIATWFAAVAAAYAFAGRDDPRRRGFGGGAATLGFVYAVVLLGEGSLRTDQRPIALAALGLVAIVAAGLLPLAWRLGPLVVAIGTVAVAALFELAPALTGVVGPLAWFGDPWSADSSAAARAAFAPGERWGGTVVTLGVVAVAAVATALVAELLERRRALLPTAAGLAAAAVVLVPLGQAWSYRGAVLWNVAAGLALALAGTAVARSRPYGGLLLHGLAAGVLVVGLGWALGDADATVFALAAVAVAYAVGVAAGVFAPAQAATAATAAAAAGFAQALRSGASVPRAGLVLAVAAAAIAAAGAALRFRPAVGAAVEGVAVPAYLVAVRCTAPELGLLSWTLGIGTAVLAAEAARPGRRVAGPPFAALATVLGAATALTAALHAGWPVDRAGFGVVGVALVAAALGWVGGWVLRGETDFAAALDGAALAVYTGGLLLTSQDGGWASWALAVGGLAMLAESMRPERRDAAWGSGVLLVGFVWVRLYLAGIRAPEPYALPVAVTALVLGHLRRRAQPATTSWTAYAPGLVIGFLPSVYLLLIDRGLARPLLLGAVALAVLLAGLRARLQAPVVLGAVALAADALTQLAPVAAALPRWVSIAAAGVVVTALGVTYERRVGELRRLRENLDSFG